MKALLQGLVFRGLNPKPKPETLNGLRVSGFGSLRQCQDSVCRGEITSPGSLHFVLSTGPRVPIIPIQGLL